MNVTVLAASVSRGRKHDVPFRSGAPAVALFQFCRFDNSPTFVRKSPTRVQPWFTSLIPAGITADSVASCAVVSGRLASPGDPTDAASSGFGTDENGADANHQIGGWHCMTSVRIDTLQEARELRDAASNESTRR